MNRRKSHADENFTWTGFRFRQFSYGEDVVGVAGAFKNKCFHFGCLRILWDVTAAYERGLPQQSENMYCRARARASAGGTERALEGHKQIDNHHPKDQSAQI
jgi:hypothetical protein